MKQKILTKEIYLQATLDSFVKLDPRTLIKNPVIFITSIGALITTVILFTGSFSWFNCQIAIWLWFTVLFANFSEAIAEGKGKAQADSLRKSRTQTLARLFKNKVESQVNAIELRKGDLVVCETNDIIPADGEIVEGLASVDESAITGESAPVVRESGGDRSAVTGGTRVLSDRIIIKITMDPGEGFLDRMIALVEGASRQKTPNEIALSLLLTALTLIFLVAVVTLKFFADYAGVASGSSLASIVTVPVLVSLLVCLIPTTIGGLLSAIGISGMDRLIQKNVIALSGRAVEAAGDIDILMLDKTGTITYGNRMATELIAAPNIGEKELYKMAYLASLSDETPEGRSIVELARSKYRELEHEEANGVEFVPFTAQTRMSGVNVGGAQIRKGAGDAIDKFITSLNGVMPVEVTRAAETIARSGGTPLVVCKDEVVYGVIYLKDIVKNGIKERFSELRRMGIKTIMITGDNPLTAASIAAEAGVDDFMAQATPEMKLKRIKDEQEKGHLVAMTGDGTNDAPALAQADVGVAMNTGTQAAREAGNMIDLDSNPTKLIEIVETGKQILMTRGSLTTFSIANDVAKYFAIIPALFATLYAVNGGAGPLSVLNVMRLGSPQSAILSAVIFNALVIVAL
ncbi:MAG: potassium-transporting ATPase subunit KdpB, partial [Bacteriovorax sp.]|nr:potassium-transporting ATPase subunit KdpB [Bacteriovorax sp.]